MSKEQLRIWAKEYRKHLSHDGILENLIKLDIYKKAKNIMLFYPMKYEVNLLKLLDDKDKTFFLPKIQQDELLCCPFCNGDELCVSSFNTHEPLTQPVEKEKIDLVIIPALCCDFQNYRLGYGGGFYDRFLSNFKGIKIVCLPKELIIETVYPESHDIKANIVVTN